MGRFEQLKKYFNDKDSIDIPRQETEKGLFSPSDLDHVEYILTRLAEKDILDTSGLAADMGGGDGRVAAVFSQHKIYILSVEHDQVLHDISRTHRTILRTNGVLNPEYITLAQGDFLEDEVYRRMNIPFESIKTFYNFKASAHQERGLAEKIEHESPEGTILILYNSVEFVPEYSWLRHIHSESLGRQRRKSSHESLLFDMYMHVFRKELWEKRDF
jgi:hypothetical protein